MTNSSQENQGPGVGKIATGVMIGIACYKVVASVIEHVLLPPIGYLIRETEFADLAIELPVEGADPVEVRYGLFVTALLSLIALLVLIWVMRMMFGRRRKRGIDSDIA